MHHASKNHPSPALPRRARLAPGFAYSTLLGLVAIVFLQSACDKGTQAPAAPQNNTSRAGTSGALTSALAQLEAKEEKINQTVWAKELRAEQCGHTMEELWDALNAATNKLDAVATFPFAQIALSEWNLTRNLAHGIQVRPPSGPARIMSHGDWQEFLAASQRDGWELLRTEFRQTTFDTDASGQPKHSQFYFSAHLSNRVRPERAILEGSLGIDWAWDPTRHSAQVRSADATQLELRSRLGPPAFDLVLEEKLAPRRNSKSIDPLLVYDLDGDGKPELILAAQNLVFRPRSSGGYTAEPLCRQPPSVIWAALVGDFDGDGTPDFLCASIGGLFLFKGMPGGKFEEPGRLVWAADRDYRFPMALTCGDVDGDGDLDVFLAQYKAPYDGGQMPTPYYDANDGFPSYLLLNDGHGQFQDATAAAGLDKKRWRRSYSASLVDLDGDGQLDLVVVSDFAGVDVYHNEGHGHFQDVTEQWLPEHHAFGMGQVVADFNLDGRPDLLVIGMPSPTVERLDQFQLWRPDATEDPSMRRRMTHGNRLFLAQPTGGFEQTPLGDSLARSGWSWGCGAFDFDNDGYPDVYIANGMESRRSVRDYEREFWLHDAYVADSTERPLPSRYLKDKVVRLRGPDGSYGGYEKNRLFWNQEGRSFLEIAHLLGVGLEEDSRNVVTADLDGDGHVDLLVTSYERWPDPKQTLRVYKNTLPDCGNWIGFQFRDGPAHFSTGARVTIHWDGHAAVRELVAGDSYRSQHPASVHFGLGQSTGVEKVEIRWPDGKTQLLSHPEVNRYHLLQ